MKTKIFIVISFLIIGLTIGVYVGFHLSFVKVAPQECVLKQFSTHNGNHYGRTQDGVLCDVKYGWYVNHPISEDDYLKIDLLLKRTIVKSFQYYTYEQIKTIPNEFTTDFKSRLEDAVFAIMPSGFVITHVLITAKPTL